MRRSAKIIENRRKNTKSFTTRIVTTSPDIFSDFAQKAVQTSDSIMLLTVSGETAIAELHYKGNNTATAAEVFEEEEEEVIKKANVSTLQKRNRGVVTAGGSSSNEATAPDLLSDTTKDISADRFRRNWFKWTHRSKVNTEKQFRGKPKRQSLERLKQYLLKLF